MIISAAGGSPARMEFVDATTTAAAATARHRDGLSAPAKFNGRGWRSYRLYCLGLRTRLFFILRHVFLAFWVEGGEE